MARLSLSSLSRPCRARGDSLLLFGPEWLAIGGVTLLDLLLAPPLHFHLLFTWRNGTAVGALLGLALLLRLAGHHRGRLVLEYVALSLTAVMALCVLTYLSLAASGPLADDRLLAFDRMLGFDWLAGFRLFEAHPQVAAVLKLVYQSLPFQYFYCALLFGLMGNGTRLRQLFWMILIAGLITCAGVWLLPAYGPFKMFGLESRGHFLPDMEHLRTGRDLTFALAELTGVICFPSFHTTMAIAYAWAFRGTGPIGLSAMGLNLVMLLAIPFVGGHYLVDMIAGAGVALACIAAVTWAPRLWRSRAMLATPQSLPQTTGTALL
jgi:hypothetical protein